MKEYSALKSSGGKFALRTFIHPLLPDRRITVDMFLGGGGFFAGNPKKSKYEHGAELQGEIVNFFKVLIHRKAAPELRRMIANTIYHEAILNEAWQILKEFRAWESGDKLFRNPHPGHIRAAWALFVVCFMNRDLTRKSCSLRVVNGQPQGAGGHNPAWNMLNLERLDYIIRRFRGVHIYKMDGLELARRHNRPDALVYGDGPYWDAGPGLYVHGWKDPREHHKFLDCVLSLDKAMVAVSSDDNELYEERLCGAGWDRQVKDFGGADSRKKTIEVLYRNPACMKAWLEQGGN